MWIRLGREVRRLLLPQAVLRGAEAWKAVGYLHGGDPTTLKPCPTGLAADQSILEEMDKPFTFRIPPGPEGSNGREDV